MIPMSPTVKFWVLLVITAALGALKALVPLVPAWSWVTTVVQVLAFVEGFLTIPQGTQEKIRALQKGASVVLLTFGLAATQTACTPAAQAVETVVEQTIVQDLAQGKTLAQVEADVARIFAGQPGADVVIIVNDALAFLIDIGVIPPNLLPQAKAMLDEVHPVALAHRAAMKESP